MCVCVCVCVEGGGEISIYWLRFYTIIYKKKIQKFGKK